MDGYKLRNQERELYNVTMRDIREFTNIMAEGNDEFIVLYAPEKINGITFLQASRYGEEDEISLQAGIMKDGKPDVMEKTASKKECLDAFTKYFKYKETPDLSSFTLLKRM